MGNTGMMRLRFHMSVNGALTVASIGNPPAAENSENSMMELEGWRAARLRPVWCRTGS
jgi:hypothetical protein